VPRQEWWIDYAVVGGASLFLLIGGFLMAVGVRNLWRGHASEQWPRTAAVVAGSQSSDIEFHYQVGGQNYSTAIRHFGQLDSNNSSEGQLILYQYPLESTVTVSYNPGNPSVATAEAGFDADALWVPGAGLAFAAPAIMFMVLWFAMSRGNNRGLGVGLGMFAGIFATLGLIFLTHGLVSMWRAYQSPHWPQAKGIVVCGRPAQGRDAPKVPERDAQFVVSTGTHFVYRYEVNGHTYFSNIRRFGQTDDRAMQNDSLYPLAGAVAVAYSPDNPALSTIETGVGNETYWIPGAGAAFFLFGMAVLLFGIPALTR
jgi:Protein of unknown function (DUF3592)